MILCCGCGNSKKKSHPASKGFDQYEWGREIGCGSFGKIYACQRKTDNLILACKVIPLKGLDREIKECNRQEIKFLHRLSGRHPALLKVYDKVDNNKEELRIWVDLCEGGTMKDANLTELWQVQQIFEQLASVLEFLHSHKLSHLDLKPENIMFLKRRGPQIKLVDFGAARRREIRKGNAVVGTLAYMAPEVALGRGCTETADMWSFGVMLYEMIEGDVLFKNMENTDEFSCKWKLDGHLFDNLTETKMSMPPMVRGLIKKLLVWEPPNRLTAGEVNRHPFIRAMDETGSRDATVLVDEAMLAKLEMFARRGAVQRALQPLIEIYSKDKNADARNVLRESFCLTDREDELQFESFYYLLTRAGVHRPKDEIREVFDGMIKEDANFDTGFTVDELMEWFDYDYVISQDERLWNCLKPLVCQTPKQLITRKSVENFIKKEHEETVLEECKKSLDKIFQRKAYSVEKFSSRFREDLSRDIFQKPGFAVIWTLIEDAITTLHPDNISDDSSSSFSSFSTSTPSHDTSSSPDGEYSVEMEMYLNIKI